MAWYYVKNGGTATGDAGRYASQQTGSFAGLGASGYYSDVADCINNSTTSPVGGDFILVSDLHNFTTANNRVFTGLNTSVAMVVCVDDANIDAARTSGNMGFENSNVLTISGLAISGMEIASQNQIQIQKSNYLSDCKISLTTSNDFLALNSDGAYLKLTNTEIETGHSTVDILVQSGGVFDMYGGSVTTTATMDNLFSAGFANGGGKASLSGVDLTGVTGTLLAGVGADATADDLIDVHFDMCKLASGVSFTNETFKSYNQRALFTRCSDSSAAAEYQYHLHAFGGDVNDDSSIFRDQDEAFTESNQKISYEIVANSDASLGSPLWLDFPIKDYAVLSAGATDTLRFYITSNTALTDKDIYVEVSYPDGTNKQTPNFASSAPTTVGGTLDLMATGTTLTTDGSSTWTGALSNLYQIDVDTSGDVGADSVPIVKVYVTIPSVTIHIASEFGQV